MSLRRLAYSTRVLVAGALLALLATGPALAQSCFKFLDTPLNTSDNCDAKPDIRRSVGVKQLVWKGHTYLLNNTLNDFELYNIDNPSQPDRVTVSRFGIDLHTDADQNLRQFSVCDDCRYGVAGFGLEGILIFDLGGGEIPNFNNKEFVSYRNVGIEGGFTYSVSGQEYLIASYLGDCSNEGSAIYKINGLGPSNRTFMGCVEGASGPIQVANGWQVPGVGGLGYLYLMDYNNVTHIFKMGVSATDLTYISSPFYGYTEYGTSVDITNHMVATASRAGVKLYSITNPGAPELLNTFNADPDPLKFMSVATLHYPVLVVAKLADKVTHAFDISDATSPRELDPDFWNTANTWNSYACSGARSLLLSQDLSTLYYARFSVLETFDSSSCGSLEPVASVSVSPTTAFPGDTITVRNTTSGSFNLSALWVTDSSGAEVAGSSTLSATTPSTITYTIPVTTPNTETYTAHVSVDGDYGAAAADQPVGLDFTPGASFTITPEATITGDTVTLTATAEGQPGGDVPFSWTVTPPSGSPIALSGQTVQQVLGESGTWAFDLTVHYTHTVDGVLYQVVVPQQTRTVSSVAAAFTVTDPALNTQPITLTSTSKVQTGVSPTYLWDITGPTAYTACPGAATCTIPADTLTPGDYSVSLTVTNPDTNDSSTANQHVAVADGSVQLGLTWTPSAPAVGDEVRYTLSGLPSDFGGNDTVTWNMGGPSCDSATQTPVCTDDGFSNPVLKCGSQSYTYSSSGTKTVTATVNYAGANFPISKVITIATGSCTSNCSYSISPTSRTIDASGGSGTVTVTTTSGCSWTAKSNASWIHVTSGATGSGSGSVGYSVDANSGASRSGSMTIAGKTFPITQAAGGTGGVDFTISNTAPGLGEEVVLTLNQDVTSTDSVTWEMGGQNCDGDGPTTTCTAFCQGEKVKHWAYASAGTKSVRVTLNGTASTTKTIAVSTSGPGCANCEATAAPDASFTFSPSDPVVGDTVTFTDTSSGGSAAQPAASALTTTAITAADFEFFPPNPNIGDPVKFTVSGATKDDSTSWDFGGPGCDSPQTAQCTPDQWADCLSISHDFSTAGTKTVTLRVNGGAAITHEVTVGSDGTCDTGGGTCSYNIYPGTKSFPAAGGNDSVSVNTTSGCDWTAASNAGWIQITAGASGTGPGSVSYSVAENTGAARQGTATIAGKTFTVSQSAASTGGGGNAPTAWSWKIVSSGQTVATSNVAEFQYTFEEAGTYLVQLTVSNCMGSDTFSQNITVVQEVKPESFVVPAVAHVSGQYNTMWKTDLRTFNPGDEPLHVAIDFLAEAQDNSGAIPGVAFTLAPKATMVIDDILSVIPGLGDNPNKGSLRFRFDGGGGALPIITSRTYNQTSAGSYGQFVPAVPVAPGEGMDLTLTGLTQNDSYRSNLGLANLTNVGVSGVTIHVLDEMGQELGSYVQSLPPLSSVQLVNVARLAGVDENLDLYSIRVDTGGQQVAAYASVVDNITGDPVYFEPGSSNEGLVYLPGVAHAPGANGSVWRTDINLFNPGTTSTEGYLEYIPEAAGALEYHVTVPLEPGEVYGFQDILGWLLGDDANTKGYFVLSGVGGAPAPQVVARTYNQTSSGTFGQSIVPFVGTELAGVGEPAYIAGVTNSADPSTGFRTNLGMLNTSSDPATVDITIYGTDGSVIGSIPAYPLSGRQFVQFNLFQAVGLGDSTLDASVEVKLRSGGPVAAYASSIDNITQDPVMIPELR